MFTGIIEETGKIKSSHKSGEGVRLSVAAKIILDGLKIGDSININGACQTVVSFNKNTFEVDVVEETLRKTNLGRLKLNEMVNLESSLTLNKKLGGHIVLGHIDCTGKILEVKKLSSSNIISVSYPAEFKNYIINVGAIAIDGISLTISEFDNKKLKVSVIPHTWSVTSLANKAKGSEVNLEFDILGKYVSRILGKDTPGESSEWLKEIGY